MRRIAIVLLLALGFMAAAVPAHSQTDNTLYAKRFQGTTVHDKVVAAMAACNPDASIECVVIIDPSMSNVAVGTTFSVPSNVLILDYRLPSSVGHVGIPPTGPIARRCCRAWPAASAAGASAPCSSRPMNSRKNA